MSESALHQQVLDLIRRAEAEAYERGKADAKRELLAFLGARDAEIAEMPKPRLRDSAVNIDTPASERQRAPKGIVPRFVRRILEAADQTRGLTPTEISVQGETEFEQMIKLASIRSELRSGRIDGRYREDQGRWFLANKDEAEGHGNDASASGSTLTERG